MSSCSFGCRAKIVPGSIAVKVPQCTPPDIFTDCFTGCAGVLTTPADPPVCGWTFGPFGSGGSVAFDGDQMIMVSDGTGIPEAMKSTLAPPPPNTLSGQWRFTEFVEPPDPGSFYLITLDDALGEVPMQVLLDGGGGVFFFTGPAAGAAGYSGVWTPASGATHVVDWSVDGAGMPSLVIDGTPVPLAFVGLFPYVPGPANVVLIDALHASGPGTLVAPFDYFVVSSGVLPPGTVYCCPDGSPVS